jgi:pyruvate dehydrogenase E1 component alpha subunit
MDVEAVEAAGKEALAYCRSGKGPIILEMKTYRYRGHSMSDPAKYRTREEVQGMREQYDPIDRARARLLECDFSESELQKIEAEIKSTVQAAADFAQQAPEPDASELWTDVLAEG